MGERDAGGALETEAAGAPEIPSAGTGGGGGVLHYYRETPEERRRKRRKKRIYVGVCLGVLAVGATIAGCLYYLSHMYDGAGGMDFIP
ncbi:MAG: hypothetical protein ABIH92_00840 [Nanoarchaeota archaeon]